jgi:hypothetical protein
MIYLLHGTGVTLIWFYSQVPQLVLAKRTPLRERRTALITTVGLLSGMSNGVGVQFTCNNWKKYHKYFRAYVKINLYYNLYLVLIETK